MESAGPFTGGKRYNSYGAFLRETFGCRVYKVVVDAGFTCPNRDGTVARGGCTYCSNSSFRPDSVPRLLPIQDQVIKGIEYLRSRYRARKFIVYFQPFSNTHAPLPQLQPLYQEALSHPEVIGLSVGTRPDCIDREKLEWFEHAARTHFVTIEYGLESIYDETLARINRGHDYRCWQHAIEWTRGRGIRICAHLILGFPWETRDQMLAMAEAVSSAGIDFLKIHHLHVVRQTAMAREYLEKPFPLLEFEGYLQLVVDFLERLSPKIRIERLFGLAPDEELIGPRWGRGKAEIQAAIEQLLAERNTCQGRRWLIGDCPH
jgi:radical SAM protein (TIGR01212 family)